MPFRAAPAGFVAALILAVLATVMAAPSAAAISQIPDEGAVALAGDRVMAAVVGDVDGDGVRELVRVLPFSANRGQLAVEVLSVRGGDVVSAGDELIQRAATPDPPDLRRRPSAENLLPMGSNEPARLLAWRLDGQERMLVASIGTVGLVRPCCLTLWQVGLDDGRTSLRFVQDTVASAASVLVEDLDDDGTDELVVLETPLPDDGESGLRSQRVVVLRWNGSAFDRLFASAEGNYAQGGLFSLGDSDGLPGAEAGFIGEPRFDQVTPTLYRISLSADDGRVSVEHALLPRAGQLAALPDGSGRLAVIGEEIVSALAWPAGELRPELVRSTPRGGHLLGVIGTGSDTRLLVVRGASLDVLDSGLAALGGIFLTRAAVRLVTDPTAWQPYFGELPGGVPAEGGGADPQPALIFGGRLLTSSPGAPKSLLERGMAALPDMAPLGLFGPGFGWAVTSGHGAAMGQRHGGLMEVPPGAFGNPMWVVPTPQLLQPERDDGELAASLAGATPAIGDASETLLTRETVTAEIAGPPGSRLRVTAATPGSEQLAEELIGDEGRTRMRLVSSTQHGQVFAVRLQLATPAGHAYSARWDVRIVREPPTVDVSVPWAPFSFDVPLTGRTAAGTWVEVDGKALGFAMDGSFATTVSAGLVPRTVLVRAADPLGNTTEQRVSVVGWLDYRQLPWVGIIAVLTMLVGFAFYLRTPRARPQPLPQRPTQRPEDEGTVEELD